MLRARTTPYRRRRWALLSVTAAALLTTSSAVSQPPAPGTAWVAATTPSPVTWTAGLTGSAPCPEGQTRSQTVRTWSFNSGIPQQRFNDGWALTSTGVGGGNAARSSVGSTDSRDHFFMNWEQVPVGARTMMAFASRGSSPSSAYTRADVNSVSNQVPVTSSTWTGRVYDVTAATDDESGRLGPWFEHRAMSGTSAWWEVDNIQLYTCTRAAVSRIAGSDRYVTSARISARFPAGQGVVYLASGENFPDSLAGSALAGRNHSPVLLVRPDAIPSAIASELQRLRPQRVVLLGGPSTISDTVRAQARSYATTGVADRYSGPNRFATAGVVARQFPVGPPVAYVASGYDFPDGLSAGALAGYQNVPLLLTSQATLPEETRAALTRLQPGRIVVVGGASVVSETVKSQLAAYTDGSVTRISGSNRYETAALVSNQFPAGTGGVYVTTGTNFPDALSGSALAATQGVPVLLVKQTDLTDPTRTALARLSPATGVALGSTSAVQPIVLDQLGAHVD